MGGYERNPAPWGLDGIPPDFNGKLLPPDWPRFEEISRGAQRRVPAMADAGVRQVINGPRASPRTTSSSSASPRSAGSSSPPGSPRTASPVPAAWGRQVAQWIVDGRAGVRPVEDGHPPLRRRTAPRLHPGPVDRRTTPPTTTSTTRTRSEAGRPLRVAHLRPARRAGCAFGEKSGWERPNWFESNAAAGDESLAPRGWAGKHWSPAIGAEALATRQAGRALRRDELRQDRDQRPGGAALLQRLCANDIDRPVGRITYTPMLNRRAGSSATSR